MKLQSTLEFISSLLFFSFLFLASIPILLKAKSNISSAYANYYVTLIGSKISQFISSYCDSSAQLKINLLNSTKIFAKDSSLYISYRNYSYVFPTYCNTTFSFTSENSSYLIKINFGKVILSKLSS
jgi:competence protein ComGC